MQPRGQRRAGPWDAPRDGSRGLTTAQSGLTIVNCGLTMVTVKCGLTTVDFGLTTLKLESAQCADPVAAAPGPDPVIRVDPSHPSLSEPVIKTRARARAADAQAEESHCRA